MQVDLRVHLRNAAEVTKAIWPDWKLSTESGKRRAGSIGKTGTVVWLSTSLTCDCVGLGTV